MRTTVQIGAQGPGEETGGAPAASPSRVCPSGLQWCVLPQSQPDTAAPSGRRSLGTADSRRLECLPCFPSPRNSLTRWAARPSSAPFEGELVFGREESWCGAVRPVPTFSAAVVRVTAASRPPMRATPRTDHPLQMSPLGGLGASGTFSTWKPAKKAQLCTSPLFWAMFSPSFG